MKLKETEFRAKVNDINQVTILSDIRNKYGIKAQEDIVLEFKGKIDKKETLIKPEKVEEIKNG